MKSKLAVAVILLGWLLLAVWLSYDYAEYQDRWIVRIFHPANSHEVHGFHILMYLVPFIYAFFGYLVNEREKLLKEMKNIVLLHFRMDILKWSVKK